MKKMLSSLVAMLLSVSLLTACGAAGSNAPGGGEADSVKVGVLAPLTGANAEFGKAFEEQFVGQDPHENRNILETLEIGWRLLGMLPREELDRIDTKILDQYYKPTEEVQ